MSDESKSAWQKATDAGQPAAESPSEDELRRRLGAKDVDDPTASEHAIVGGPPSVSRPTVVRNPFLVALTTITSILAAVAIIIYIVAASHTGPYGEPDPAGQLPILLAGTSWLEIAGVSLLATLVAGAVTWKRPE